MLKLIAIVGTSLKPSTNRQLLQYMQKRFADKAEVACWSRPFPVFNKPADKQVPAEYWKLLLKSKRSVALLSVLLVWSLYSSCFDRRSCLVVLWYLPFWTNQSWLQVLLTVRLVHLVPNCNRQILNTHDQGKCSSRWILALHTLADICLSGDGDLDVIKSGCHLDDFRIFVKITEKLRNAQNCL